MYGFKLTIYFLVTYSLLTKVNSNFDSNDINRPIYQRNVKLAADPGEPLFLTPYIESGNIEVGKNLSRVGPLEGTTVVSYSGYLTVNPTYNSNMFFWFFEALVSFIIIFFSI